MTEVIFNYYKNITDIYLDKFRKTEDKSIAFRTEFEKFLKYYLENNTNLNELLKDFYKIHKIESINDISHKLKKKLNAITHGEYIPSEKDVKSYYEAIIRIIYTATKVEPGQTIKDLLNVDQNNLLNELNEKQKLAVLEKNRIVYVNAGPGTGKTHLLVNKIYHLIRESNSIENIVALTYTNSSANELESRISEKIFYSGYKEFNIFSGTIHSFAFKTLRSYAKSINSTDYDFSILDDEEIEFFADEICLILGSKYSSKEIISILQGSSSNIYLTKELIEKIDLIKRKYKLISFKDILLHFQKAIQSNPEFVSWIGDKISFLLVDEAQDLTKLEYEIIDLLIKNINIKIFLVGDPRQNIFGFNGGSYEHLNAFLNKHKSQYSEIVLDTSYRCPDEIFKIVNKFNFTDCTNFPIKSSNNCGEFKLVEFGHKNKEAIEIVKIVKEINDYKNTAILFTSLKYFDLIAGFLNEHNISFISVGGKKYLKKYVRFIFHVFRVIQDQTNIYSWKYIARQMNITLNNNIEELNNSIINEVFIKNPEGKKLIEVVFDNDLIFKASSDVLMILWANFKDLIISRNKNFLRTEIENDFKELIKISQSYVSIEEFVTAFALDKESFKNFYIKDLEIESLEKNSNNRLTISTIHSAKGLEWENVIIVGLSDGLFPNPYFCDVAGDPEKTRNNYNDEMKKLYVGMTRSKNRLILTYPLGYDNRYGKTFYVKKSRFLQKIEL